MERNPAEYRAEVVVRLDQGYFAASRLTAYWPAIAQYRAIDDSRAASRDASTELVVEGGHSRILLIQPATVET